MNKEQQNAAKNAMIEWLSNPNELGKAPFKIECAKEFELHDMLYYIFKFKEKLTGNWMLAVCGGYEDDSLEHCGHIFSKMDPYHDKSAVKDATAIVEDIRSYWMERARTQELFQENYKKNQDFITQDVIPAEDIENQFVKTETRFFLTVGHVDCPTGMIVVADPLAYLPDLSFSPTLSKSIPIGTYPVEVSICRQEGLGIRMCTAKLKVTESRAIKYEKATATKDTVIQLKQDTMEGFPVDAGMMCFCDEKVAHEFKDFLDKWHESNSGKNHYDDYFQAFFAESFNLLPAYQQEDGDFIEWANPNTGNKMVMIASGFGDGFYNCYYGYDSEDEICEIIVPMVNPSIFELS